MAVLLVAAALLLGLAAYAALSDDGERGQPVAVAPIEHVAPPPPPALPPAPPAAPPPAAAHPPGPGDDQVVDIENGVRVIRPRRPAANAPGQAIPVAPAR